VPAETITSQTGIWETPSRLRLARVQNPEQVSRRLGSWFHDAEAGRLYLRSTGARTVDQGIYWLESSDKAAFTVKASHVHLRNLQATLGQHGFLLEGKKLSHITVEGCRAFCNSWAGIQVTGDDHRIHRNETFQNNTYGIQLRFGVNRVHVTDNTCLFNGPNNGEATGSSVPTDCTRMSTGTKPATASASRTSFVTMSSKAIRRLAPTGSTTTPCSWTVSACEAACIATEARPAR
jgi:hypothetical protein